MRFSKQAAIALVVTILALSAMTGVAGAKNNTVERTWMEGAAQCTGDFRVNPNGLVHEWRDDPDCKYLGTHQALHLTFQPVGDQWPEPDCETLVYDEATQTYVANPNYLRAIADWNTNTYGGALANELTAASYHVCFYSQ